MTTGLAIALLVLSALFFASHRFVIRQSHDRLALLAGFNAISVALGVVLLPFVPPLPWAAAPYLLASATLYAFAMFCVARGFSHADFGVITPLQSAIKVVVIAFLAAGFLDEQAGAAEWIAAALVVVSYIIQLAPRELERRDALALPIFALGAGVASGCQYIADVGGIRVSAEPASYIAWNLMIGLPIVLYGLITRRRSLRSEFATQRQWIVLAAFLDIVGYSLILVVVYKLAVLSVLPLLNLDIVFATLIGLALIGERHAGRRLAAAGLLLIAALLAQLG